MTDRIPGEAGRMNPYERNIPIVYVTGFLRGLVFFLPIFALYVQQELFTVLNVTLIIATNAIVNTVFEVPSGAFADLFGRKNTLLLAGALLIVSIGCLTVGDTLTFFLLYAVLNGIAESLFSGTDTAILHDSLKANGQEGRFKKVLGVSGSLWPLGATLSSLIGGFLAAQSLLLPVAVTIIPFSLAFLLTFLITEPPYERETHGNIWRQMRDGFRTVITKRQVLLLSIAGFLAHAFGEVAHQLKPLFFAAKAIPIEAYGIIFAVAFGLSSLGYLASHAVSERVGNKTTLVWCAIITAVTLIGAVYAPGLWAAAILVSGSFFWGLRWPVVDHLLNAAAPSKHRVTVISFGNLANKIGLALFAPLFGYLADAYTINTVFALLAFPSFWVAVVFLMLKPDAEAA